MGRMMTAAVFAGAMISSGSACAMKPATNATATTATSAFVRCTVIGADKLPADLGGADAVCRAIDAAAAAALAASGTAAGSATLVVRVLGPHMLAATLTTADGRSLPAQEVAVSDRALHAGALAMLGKALAAQLAGTR